MRTLTFQELLDENVLEIGDGYRAKNAELGGNGPIFLRGAYVQDDGLRLDSPDRFRAEVVERLGGKLGRPGDVVVTTKGNSTGRVAFIPDDMPDFAYSPHLSFWRSRNEEVLDQGFLRFWSMSRELHDQINAMKVSTDMAPYLSLRDQRRLRITVPAIEDQRRIAAVLGALEDKIELNRKLNRTLEQIAQAIFKSWFIDFDGHDDLVESELGPIPRGWTWVPFARAGKWVSGGTPSKERPDYWNGEIPWFSAKSLGPMWLHHSDDRVTETGANNGTRVVPRRSVLFIVRGMSLAKEWRIGITGREATLNQDLKAIVDDGTVVPELLLLWTLVHREKVRERADEAGHGTKRLPTDVLHQFHLAMPDRETQEEMAIGLTSILGRIETSQAQSATLSSLRDALLPKLISGEIRVPDLGDDELGVAV